MKKLTIFTIFLFLSYLIPSYSVSQDQPLNQIDSCGLKQGRWLEYFPEEENFDFAIITYVDNLKEGAFTAFTADSTIYMKGFFWKDLLHGKHYTYYENGKIQMETYYLEGKENGTRILYYNNGEIHTKVDFIANEKHGSYYFYYQNGLIQQIGEFRNGKKSGTWITYSPKGDITSTTNYEE